MATGNEFMEQLELRFGQLSKEEKLEKIVDFQKRLTEMKRSGLSEAEAVARLEAELPLPPPAAGEDEDYGSIHHPKKPLLTAVLYVAAMAAVLLAAWLFTRLLG